MERPFSEVTPEEIAKLDSHSLVGCFYELAGQKRPMEMFYGSTPEFGVYSYNVEELKLELVHRLSQSTT